jgi:5-methylcytosine-specific restriction endonuclease McrA
MAKNREQNKQQCKTWYANNQDKVKAYRERNKPVRREKRKPMEKRYRERHRVERVAYNREYRNAHREWARKCRRDWCRLNPEKAKANMHRRLARKRNAPGSHTADDLRALYAEQCGYCAYCGIALHDKYHVDHVQPLSRGGSNAPDNLLLTCQSCNLSKGSKTYAEWKAVRGW